MAKLKMSADYLMDTLLRRGNFCTVDNVTWDPVRRVVTLELSGSDVPDAEFVNIEVETKRCNLVAAPLVIV